MYAPEDPIHFHPSHDIDVCKCVKVQRIIKMIAGKTLEIGWNGTTSNFSEEARSLIEPLRSQTLPMRNDGSASLSNCINKK